LAASLVFVAHPGAGRSAFARRWPQFAAALAARGLLHTVQETARPGHAALLAREAEAGGARLVVAVGGDGTLHEVVNGLLDGRSTLGDDLAVGLIPAGRGSDYARTLRAPRDPTELVERFARWLEGDRAAARTVDAGEVSYVSTAVVAGRPAPSGAGDHERESRRFINAAGIGFSPFVAQRTRRFPDRLGPYLYTAAGLLTILDWRERGVRLRWNDAGEEERAVESIEVALGRYEGGGMLVAPDAELSDGLFDVMVVDSVSRIEMLTFSWRIRSGTHVTSPRVSVRRARSLDVDVEDGCGPLYLQADGELLGRDPFRLRVLPSAVRVVC
jgi:YegS/Rv2252/BmrU family lipid kinase